MIEACSPIRRFAANSTDHGYTETMLRWSDDWYPAAGRGVVVGLLDSSFDVQIPDLDGADLVTGDFICSENGKTGMVEHGTHSVATLIGQGHHQIRGIVPQSRLLVAKVVGPDGIANPRAVVEAIDWLISSGSEIIIIPLGESIERDEIIQQLEHGSECGVVFFAAAGNDYPEPLLFPARHPLAVAVGAADLQGNLLPECSRLPRLDLVAPGLNIAAPIRGRVIQRRRGTSVACVVAAGLATLALSAKVIPLEEMCRMSVLSALRGSRVIQARSPPRMQV